MWFGMRRHLRVGVLGRVESVEIVDCSVGESGFKRKCKFAVLLVWG